MKSKVLILAGVFLLSASIASAVVVANTATTLPKGTFSITGGGSVKINPSFNTANDLGFFGMLGVGIHKKMDLGLKWIYNDFIGLDLEYNLKKSKKTFNLSVDLGVNYRYSSEVMGASINLLASKYFKGLEAYAAIEDNLLFPSGGVNNSLNGIIGVDIKIVRSVTALIEFDFPILGYSGTWLPTANIGVCWYLGDNLDFYN